MKSVMKKSILYTLSLICCLFLAACDSQGPTVAPSTLVIEPDALTLQASDSTKTLDLKLSCGCGFTLNVAAITGDTNVIRYTPMENMGAVLTKHSLRFEYSPSAFPGPHSVKLTFEAEKHFVIYTDSVVVSTE